MVLNQQRMSDHMCREWLVSLWQLLKLCSINLSVLFDCHQVPIMIPSYISIAKCKPYISNECPSNHAPIHSRIHCLCSAGAFCICSALWRGFIPKIRWRPGHFTNKRSSLKLWHLDLDMQLKIVLLAETKVLSDVAGVQECGVLCNIHRDDCNTLIYNEDTRKCHLIKVDLRLE